MVSEPSSPASRAEIPGRGALAHEWIEPHGGAEKVLDEFALIAPGADIHCLWSDDPARYAGMMVRESWMANTALRRHKSLALPMMSSTWRHRPGEYDWALVSSYAFAHHIRFRGQRHTPTFHFVHSPARYLWAPETDPRGQSSIVRLASPPLRRLDRRRARAHEHVACNSAYIADRARRSWDVEPRVIYPPVDVARIARARTWVDELPPLDADIFKSLPVDFLLAASRLVPYKAVDKVIEAGARLSLPVVVAGDGPDRQRLEHLAASLSTPVTFLRRVSDELLYALYQNAVAYIFLPIEDFGIMPIEAMAAGGRVVVNTEGGASESIAFGTASRADAQDPLAIDEAIREVASQNAFADANLLAATFGRERFRDQIAAWVREDL